MAKNLLNKYVWLVETIHKAKKISFEDINGRWLDNDHASETTANFIETHLFYINFLNKQNKTI